MILLVLMSCRHDSERRPGTIVRESPPLGDGESALTEDRIRWSETLEGLRIGLELPSSVQLSNLGAQRVPQVTAQLHFSNVGSSPIRIFIVRTEIFRALISSLRVRRASTREVISLQPEPHPHGYVVTEQDFFLIEPGSEQVFTQSLIITEQMSQAGELVVEWIYENRSRSWPGGIQTMDGITQPLFGGGDISHIWVNRLTVSTRVAVTP